MIHMITIAQFFKKLFSVNLAFFVLLMVLLSGVVFADAIKPLSAKSVVPYTIEFSVRSGMGNLEIAQALEDGGIIRSSIAFRVYSFLVGKARSFQPGAYLVGPEQSVGDIVSLLTRGPVAVEVLITPGMTLIEIEDILVAKRIVDVDALASFPVDTLARTYPFLGRAKSLEGFLFPDTYQFYPHSTPAIVVGKFLDNFQAKMEPLLPCSRFWQEENHPPKAECQNSLQGLHNQENNDTMHWLILASILEKEVTNKNEAQLVAGILEKRLAIGMPLQVDASIIYAKCQRFISCPALTRADFRIVSPYNTYLHKGLPPTPISNPGIDAISAARSPVRSNYLYYLSDPRTQRTIFSKTFDEHNANRSTYLH